MEVAMAIGTELVSLKGMLASHYYKGHLSLKAMKTADSEESSVDLSGEPPDS